MQKSLSPVCLTLERIFGAHKVTEDLLGVAMESVAPVPGASLTTALWDATFQAFFTELVIHGAFLGVRQHVVGFSEKVEFVLCSLLPRVLQRMVLEGEFAIAEERWDAIEAERNMYNLWRETKGALCPNCKLL